MLKNKDVVKLIKIVIFVALTFLFFAQSIAFDGMYRSDLPVHIKFGLENKNTYSLVYFVLKILYFPSGNTIFIAMFLAAIVILTIHVTYKLFKYLIGESNDLLIYIAAVVCNIVMAIYIPDINKTRYLSTIGPTLLHNSTYICMKLVGIIVILYYFKITKNYLKKIKLSQWLCFTLLLTIVNLIKPNFIIMFSLVMLLEFIYDLIKTKGKALKQIIILGMSVLVSLIVLILQYKILYTGDNASSSIGFRFGYNLNYWSNHPYIAVIQSLAFPLFVLIFNFKELIRDRKYRIMNTIGLIGFIQYLCLIETGGRINAFNWIWGYAMGIFVLFIGGIYKLYQKTITLDRLSIKKGKKIYLVTAIIILALHFISGMDYIRILLQGVKYY
jgi:hypothetical protein